MSHKGLKLLAGGALALIQLMIPVQASAVGNGIAFTFREFFVPANAHPVNADSLDFTYHSCVDVIDNGIIQETGYFWVSSFQDVDSVVDSQINYYQANGYHLYAKYTFHGEQCSMLQGTCNNDTRVNYDVTQASISLYVDPDSDTTLAIQNCAVVANGTADDRFLGTANAIASPPSQKTETNDLANGDFEIVFTNWAFSPDGQELFRNGANPLGAQILHFNANTTLLGGPLLMNHHPEGSGNIYWID